MHLHGKKVKMRMGSSFVLTQIEVAVPSILLLQQIATKMHANAMLMCTTHMGGALSHRLIEANLETGHNDSNTRFR